jgi:hypothetical protein
MDWEKLPRRLIIVIGLVLWTGWAMTVEPYGKRPQEIRLGKLALVVTGLVVAWDRWGRVDRDAEAERQRRDLRRDLARAVDPRRPVGDGAPTGADRFPVGTLVDLGPCPACGGGPTAVTPAPPGTVQVRCRRCGLIATPPELQPMPPA